MQRIGYVHEPALDVEAALLKLSKNEQDAFQKGAKEFVSKIFGKDVESCELRPASAPVTISVAQTSAPDATAPATCMLLVVHRLSCRSVATCIPVNES